MTPTYKPGDRVTRTGESVFFADFDLLHGVDYVVHATDEHGFLIFDGNLEASFNPRGFRPADEEGKT